MVRCIKGGPTSQQRGPSPHASAALEASAQGDQLLQAVATKLRAVLCELLPVGQAAAVGQGCEAFAADQHAREPAQLPSTSGSSPAPAGYVDPDFLQCKPMTTAKDQSAGTSGREGGSSSMWDPPVGKSASYIGPDFSQCKPMTTAKDQSAGTSGREGGGCSSMWDPSVGKSAGYVGPDFSQCKPVTTAKDQSARTSGHEGGSSSSSSMWDPPMGKLAKPGATRMFPGKGRGVFWPRMPCLRCGCPWWQGEDWDAKCMR